MNSLSHFWNWNFLGGVFIGSSLLVPLEVQAEVTISNIRSSQRNGTKLVDIDYDITGTTDTTTVRIQISDDGGITFNVPTASLSGAFGAGITPGTNKRITWDAGVDWNNKLSNTTRFRVGAGKALPGAVFSDNFDDNSIDATKWTTSGNTVTEAAQQMQIHTNETDKGGNLYSKPFLLQGRGVITVSRRVYLHNAARYAVQGFEIKVGTFTMFSVKYADMIYNSSPQKSCFGIYLCRKDGNPHDVSRYVDASNPVTAIWDTWYDEKIVYEPDTGMAHYSINGMPKIDYNVGILPITVGASAQLSINAWGWWTGYYQLFDNLEVMQEGAVMTTSADSFNIGLDTRDVYPMTNLKPVLRDATQSDGRRFISSKTQNVALARSVASKTTYLLQLKMPNFFANGWAIGQSGLGTFYGLEIARESSSEDVKAKSGDLIYYKFGGAAPSEATPASDWKPTVFDGIIDTALVEGTYYLKVVVNKGADPVIIQAFYKSLRLCEPNGDPVNKLNPAKPLWLVAHGKRNGENSFQKMNSAVRNGTGAKQVVEVDWASGADGSFLDLSAGRYFINLGKNLSGIIQDIGFARKNLNWVGHSWGTYIGYETARELGGVDRFFALDPARTADNYDKNRIDFGEAKISLRSTSVRGGNESLLTLGNDKLAETCEFSIRLLSETHTGFAIKPLFYHSLPRDWFIRAMNDHTSDVYWTFLHEKMMRTQVEPAMPSSWGGFISNGVSGFDLECHGATISKGDTNVFAWHEFIVFKNEKKKQMEARATKKLNGSLTWSIESH